MNGNYLECTDRIFAWYLFTKPVGEAEIQYPSTQRTECSASELCRNCQACISNSGARGSMPLCCRHFLRRKDSCLRGRSPFISSAGNRAGCMGESAAYTSNNSAGIMTSAVIPKELRPALDAWASSNSEGITTSPRASSVVLPGRWWMVKN